MLDLIVLAALRASHKWPVNTQAHQALQAFATELRQLALQERENGTKA